MCKMRYSRAAVQVVLVVTAVLALVGLSVPSAIAASTLPFRISGSISAVSGPSAFVGPSVQRYSSASALPFTPLRYDQVNAVDGSYGFTLEATGGVPVAATEIGFDPAASRQLIAVGIPSSAAVSAMVHGPANATSSASSASPRSLV